MKILNEIEVEGLNRLVSDIEVHTQGEIVPVVAKNSQIYHSSRLTCGIIFLFVFQILFDFFAPFNIRHHELWVELSGLVFGFFIGGLPFLLRLLTPKQRLYEEVFEKAFQAFYKNSLHKTEAKTGILIYVSLLEHQVVVMADEGINAKVKQDQWAKVVELIIQGIKGGSLAKGLEEGLRECGEVLKKHFPSEKNNPNELPNKVIFQ